MTANRVTKPILVMSRLETKTTLSIYFKTETFIKRTGYKVIEEPETSGEHSAAQRLAAARSHFDP